MPLDVFDDFELLEGQNNYSMLNNLKERIIVVPGKISYVIWVKSQSPECHCGK